MADSLWADGATMVCIARQTMVAPCLAMQTLLGRAEWIIIFMRSLKGVQIPLGRHVALLSW